ncbi:phosphatases II, partial [Nadsonia fulvescens var. elongata DSM 6958]
DRIYLAAYDNTPIDTDTAVHFTIDDALPYNAFHHDFGPLHVGHLYRFAVALHEILGDPENEGKVIVLYSRTNPRDRANTACLLCCYMVLIQSWPPHLALAPIAQAEPPYMPFRDAGYSQADFILTIQDIVYGVWQAKEKKLLDLKTFNLADYERYERVDQGDFNEIYPFFVAFASPQQDESDYGKCIDQPFNNVLEYFNDHDVQCVVRLNSHLYDKTEFENRNIKHIDMIFDDGSCPTMDIVKNFLGVVEGVKSQGGKVAVHCKAGLGRTGCLIGAHLIYTYGFTANEVISYMRFLRPGMVVGPQQHWLYLHQNEFRDWKRTLMVSEIPDPSLAGYSSLVPYHSQQASLVPHTPEKLGLNVQQNHSAVLPVPTPGQPRKNSPSPGNKVRAEAVTPHRTSPKKFI